ncbi:MAG: hypothetical protein KME52_26415 [Desmonostoc geniculatum HA4340-LM1]|nr:hypothetical protein [Desmonostoc geniculatum HA4340-LM1]
MPILKTHVALNVSNIEKSVAFYRAMFGVEFTEDNTDCCYALQDKVWVTDPDGNRWEVFVVKVGDTAPEKNVAVGQSVSKSCCG